MNDEMSSHSQFEVSNCLDGRFWNPEVNSKHGSGHGRCHPDSHIAQPEARIAVKDPINIPDIGALFRRCAEQNSIKRFREKLRSWNNHPSNPAVVEKKKPLRFDLPNDIIYLLLDHLCEWDASNFLAAMGWQAPDWYWRARFPRDIIFEIEEWTPPADVDWEFLCLRAEGLLETSRWVLNRQRIIRILKGTKILFLARGGGEVRN